MRRKLKAYLREKACQVLDKLWSMVTDDDGPIALERRVYHLECKLEEAQGEIEWLEQPFSWKEA